MIRPITLTIRLAANFVAGHFLLALTFLGTEFFLLNGPKTWVLVGISFPMAVVLVAFEVFDNKGKKKFGHDVSSFQGQYWCPANTAADLDGDGKLEVLFGNAAYRSNGSMMIGPVSLPASLGIRSRKCPGNDTPKTSSPPRRPCRGPHARR